MSKKDEIVVRLTAKRYTPEHLAEIRKAAKEQYGNDMTEFVHLCIGYYLEGYWFPRRIEVSTPLFREVAKKAEAENKTIETFVAERLRQN